MAQDFQLVDEFGGYRAKKDVTKLAGNFLVSGSQNVVVTDADTVKSRQGYTIYGSEDAALTPIVSSFEWATHRGVEQPLRSKNNLLQYYDVNDADWVDLLADAVFTSDAFNFTSWWDSTTELQDLLLMVNGTSNIYTWSGGTTTFSSAHAGTTSTITASTIAFVDSNPDTITDSGSGFVAAGFIAGDTIIVTGAGTAENNDTFTIASVTAGTLTLTAGDSLVAEAASASVTITAQGDTITLEGVTTWAEEGFLTAGTRKVVISGTTYTYTGGEGEIALTGVSPDPTSGGHTTGDSVAQWVRTTENSAITGLPNAFNNTIIEVLDNQVYVGDTSSREVYVSKTTNYLDFGFSAPRAPTEGALLTLDDVAIGFAAQEDAMYISAGKNFWFRTKFVTSDDLLTESFSVTRLKTNTQAGAVSQSAIGKIKNSVSFITNEPTFDTLGRVENFNTPQAKPISDPIKTDFSGYDFTGAHVKYFQNNVYIAVPKEDLLLRYNLDRQYWEAPWVIPAGRLAVIGGALYLHSNVTPETYKLFEGYNDNGQAINAVARFAYLPWGKRANLKVHDEWFTEGYISTNTNLGLTLRYDWQGYTQEVFDTYTGDTTNNYIYVESSRGNLGKQELGKQKLGGSDAASSVKNKFRVISEMPPLDYYEIQAEYSSNDIDQNWEVLSYGGNIQPSKTDNNYIKQGV